MGGAHVRYEEEEKYIYIYTVLIRKPERK